MKNYIKPALECVDLRAEEKIAATGSAEICTYHDGACTYEGELITWYTGNLG